LVGFKRVTLYRYGSGQTADSHRLVVYFGDETYEWMPVEGLLDFDEYRDEAAKQPVVKARARYRRALEDAEEWWAAQCRATETPAARAAAAARAREEEALRRSVGAMPQAGSSSAPAPAVPAVVGRLIQLTGSLKAPASNL
jgi:hypothetical protein